MIENAHSRRLKISYWKEYRGGGTTLRIIQYHGKEEPTHARARALSSSIQYRVDKVKKRERKRRGREKLKGTRVCPA